MAGSAYAAHVEAERAAKDEFFRTSPHSPLPLDRRGGFRGLTYFDPDRAYRIVGLRLDPAGGDRGQIAIPTTDGRLRNARRAVTFSFEIPTGAGALTAYVFDDDASGSLFVPFKDATTGSETYVVGRYLDVDPEPDASYVLDFNLAYNPWCAYSPHYSCPLTPAENHLPFPIPAGERSFEENA